MLRLVLASLLLLAPGSPAFAASCAQRAAEVASQTGGRVVKVTRVGDSCRIRVVVGGQGQRPRSRVVVVRR